MPEPAGPWLNAPFDEVAPGAADAARSISSDPNLSQPQRDRLQRLVSETKLAWRELSMHRHESKRQLDPGELYDAQHELLVTAFYAADFQPIGQPEIDRLKEALAEIGEAATKLADEIWKAGKDVSLTARWRLYCYKHPDLMKTLPDHLSGVAQLVNCIGSFFADAAPHYKPAGPVLPVGQPKSQDALRTEVIRKIASVCEKHFGTPLYSTVATLANASLNRNDITDVVVRGSLRKTSTPQPPR
jgi:hypothetical protein